MACFAFCGEGDLLDPFVAGDEFAFRWFAEDDGFGVDGELVCFAHSCPADFFADNVEDCYVVAGDLRGVEEVVDGDDLGCDGGFGVDAAAAEDGGVGFLFCVFVWEEGWDLEVVM